MLKNTTCCFWSHHAITMPSSMVDLVAIGVDSLTFPRYSVVHLTKAIWDRATQSISARSNRILQSNWQRQILEVPPDLNSCGHKGKKHMLRNRFNRKASFWFCPISNKKVKTHICCPMDCGCNGLQICVFMPKCTSNYSKKSKVWISLLTPGIKLIPCSFAPYRWLMSQLLNAPITQRHRSCFHPMNMILWFVISWGQPRNGNSNEWTPAVPALAQWWTI